MSIRFVPLEDGRCAFLNETVDAFVTTTAGSQVFYSREQIEDSIRDPDLAQRCLDHLPAEFFPPAP